jgi:CRISPR-associated protein Cas2
MRRQDILVTYDVDTSTKAGAKRLKKVARVCEGFGQRVQYSVFECTVSEAQLELLEARIQDIMNPEQDSLRIYVLQGGRDRSVRTYGRDRYIDFDSPMVL